MSAGSRDVNEPDKPFQFLFRVRYAECDAQDVVFNARYADYVDLAATEFLRAAGLDYRELLESGLDNQVVRLELQWRAPARFDDILCAEVWLAAVGRTSYTLHTRFRLHDSGDLVASAEAVYVMVTRADWRKTPVPEWLSDKLAHGALGRVTDQSGHQN